MASASNAPATTTVPVPVAKTKTTNEKWVEANRDKLFPDDLQRTFQVVVTTHPAMGVSDTMLTIQQLKTCSLENAAACADAVTVCCYQVLGTTQFMSVIPDEANETAIGNTAYVALHHSDAQVRAKWTQVFQAWQAKPLVAKEIACLIS